MSYWGVLGKQNQFTWIEKTKYVEWKSPWQIITLRVNGKSIDIPRIKLAEVSNWRIYIAETLRQMRNNID